MPITLAIDDEIYQDDHGWEELALNDYADQWSHCGEWASILRRESFGPIVFDNTKPPAVTLIIWQCAVCHEPLFCLVTADVG
jgi:hypothetical protein